MANEKTFIIDIVTPDKTAFNCKAISLTAPGVEGYFGVLANHAPMMAELHPGKLQIVEPEDVRCLVVIGGGFLEVADNRVVVLADSVDYIEQKEVRDFNGLNMAEADLALADAEKRLQDIQ